MGCAWFVQRLADPDANTHADSNPDTHSNPYADAHTNSDAYTVAERIVV